MAADINTIIQIIIFPIVTLLLWTLMFNSKNSRFTKFVVEGGYILFVIPIMTLTFLTIPFVAIAFWMNTTDVTDEIVKLYMAVVIIFIIIVEYYYIKRVIGQIEEKEQMSIWDVMKREMSSEHRENRKLTRDKRANESTTYFDEISKMNDEKRKIDLEKKEKLKRALLNEYE